MSGKQHVQFKVVAGEHVGRVFTLGSTVFTIGRDGASSIVISDPLASRHHAEIRRDPADQPEIADCGSSNGMQVNGRQANRVVLRHGDEVTIGTLTFHVMISPSRTTVPAAHLPKVTNVGGLYPRRTIPPSQTGTIALQPREEIRVGRDARSELLLDHPQVSRQHATLTLRDDGQLAVTDLDSTNGTFVDGQRVHGTRAVSDGAELTFGPYTVRFQQRQLVRATVDGTVRIDCVGVSKTVGDGVRLLDDLTFSVLPREFVCVVGGSGAGKSTLVDALSGVRLANGGEVLYNGANYYERLEAYRSVIGYVPQDDIVPTELSVERALLYAAKLRLPSDTTRTEIRSRVAEVMRDLGLTARRAVPIRNLSGGQRKRVSIGAELLSKPTVFFLDEPTSGLDPGLEGRMMALLRQLADQGRTIILITHATQNIDLCDQICFLAPGGHLAYFGPPREALGYFGADKFADIYTRIEEEPHKEVWATRFRQSPNYAKLVTSRLGSTHSLSGTSTPKLASPTRAGVASQMHQFLLLCQRYGETIVRDRKNFLTLLVQAPVIAAMIMIAYHQAVLRLAPAGSGNWGKARQLVFLLALVAVWFGTSNAAREIVKESAIYARERRVMLGLGPYIASKFIVLTGLSGLQNLILLVPLLVAGVQRGTLPAIYLTLVLGSMAGIGMGLVISSLASNPDRASSLVPLLLIPQVIFSGVMVDLGENAAVKALSHIMITKWAYRAIGAVSEIDSLRQGAGSTREFDLHLAQYLLILFTFILIATVLVALFLRRKDVARS